MPKQTYPHLDRLAAMSRNERDQLLTPGAFARAAQKPLPATPRAAAPVATAPKPAAAVPAKPVVPAPTKLTTAEEYAKKRLAMTRQQFSLLDPGDRARFLREGGQLIDPQPPAKMTHKNGQLTREGFTNLSPAAKAAHCKSGAGIID